MRKDSSIPQRKSVRLEGFDYASGGAYFITVCTESKAPCFERYPELKAIVEVEWDSLPARFPSVTADVFVAMPNHVHGILILDQAGRAGSSPAPTAGRRGCTVSIEEVRSFIAIELPENIKGRLGELQSRLQSGKSRARWVAPESIHLTLKFLGDVKPDREAELAAGVVAAVQGARRFTLPVGGFGAFPSLSHPRVVWAGCQPVPPLELLQHRVEQAMERLGFPLEGRAFHPHLTLGRAQRDARASAFRDLEDRITALAFDGEVAVESVDLMESQLARDGARYTRRHAAALAA